MDTNTLLTICEKIATNGNTPSVALLRAKSPQKLPLPQAIKIIKSYNAGARSNAIGSTHIETVEEPTQLSIEQRLDALELENQSLKQRVQVLEEKRVKPV